MSGDELVAERRGNVIVARINRPDARNAVNSAVMHGLAEVIREAEADVDIRAVVVTGTGDRAFCAGADLKELAAGGGSAPEEFLRLVHGQVSFPFIAAVNGVAVGAGCELSLGADLVVAASSASFGLPEVKRGLFPGSGAVTVARKLPLGLALELALTGERITAQRAYEMGLVNRVVDPDELLDAALAMAAIVAANAPLALQATKELVRMSAAGAPETTARLHEWQARVFSSDDAREGTAAFIEKRDPVWTGR